MKNLSNKTFEKILIIQTAFIGDVILTTPLIRELKNIYPKAIISIIVTPISSILMETNPHISEVIKLNKQNKSIFNFFKFICKIRKQKFDLCIAPHSSLRSGLIAFLSGIPYRIGFNRYAQRFLLTHKINHPKTGHKITKNLQLLTPLKDISINSDSIQTELFPSIEHKKKVSSIFNKLDNDYKKVLIAPGSVWFTKRWPLEYYTELCIKILTTKSIIILSGSQAEKEICENIFNDICYNMPELKERIIITAGLFNLLETSEAVSLCDCVICNDSATLHIANANKTPAIAIFGPTVKEFGYYPYQQKDKLLEIALECRPCGKHGGKFCPQGHFLCMKKISVEMVFAEVKSLI